MLNRKRIDALLLCAGMILVLFFSFAFIAHEADHECSGEHCLVCQAIATNINLLSLLGWAMPLLLALMILHWSMAVRMVWRRFVPLVCGTLVSLKIRMND